MDQKTVTAFGRKQDYPQVFAVPIRRLPTYDKERTSETMNDHYWRRLGTSGRRQCSRWFCQTVFVYTQTILLIDLLSVLTKERLATKRRIVASADTVW